MGLVDKLTELDEYIWKQYEKVTQYCHKEYGWNKYDLASKTLAGETASLSGSSTYIFLTGIEGNDTIAITGGAVVGLVAVSNHYLKRNLIKRKEEREIKLLERTGAVNEHWFNALRPAMALGWTAIFGYFAYTFATGQYHPPPESSSLSSEEYDLFSSLTLTSMFAFHIFKTSTDYFLDQIMTPPAKKKSVLKTLYEKVTGKLQVTPVLQLEPNKYHTIEDIVGDA